MKKDYDEFYRVVEYKFFGLIPASRLGAKAAAGIGALMMTILGAYCKKLLFG